MPLSANDTRNTTPSPPAIGWLVRLRADDMSDAEICAFADWLAEDAAHAEAFNAAEKLFDDMALAARGQSVCRNLDHAPSADPPAQRLGRRSRRWLTAALALAAIWLFAVNTLLPVRWHPFDALTSDYHTQTGELREFVLSDGSRVLLNTDSAVSVDFNDAERRIVLRRGQARFSVAKNARRPFVADANGLTVRALGTVFEVYRRDSGEVTVTVQEHAVAAGLYPEASSAEVEIGAGQQLHYRPGQPLAKPEAARLEQTTAWQRRRLVINDQPLSTLIDELSRYRNGRILLSDDRLKKLRITGMFALDDPDAVLQSVGNALALKQTRIGPWWVLLHR